MVIGILAAITIVAYNGVQQRARNAQVVAGVNTYMKALRSYHAVNSAYPTTGGCLGAGYPSDQCWQGDSGTHYINSTLDSNLANFIQTKPTLATSLFSIGITNNMRAGALYSTNTSPHIVYYLSGTNQSCAIAGATGGNEGGLVTQCVLILP